MTTLHTWAYYGFFKPTIMEALYRAPLPSSVDNFPRIYFTTTFQKIDGRDITYGDAFHVGKTIFFMQNYPEKTHPYAKIIYFSS